MGSRAERKDIHDHIAAKVFDDIKTELEQDRFIIPEEIIEPHPQTSQQIRTAACNYLK